MSRKKSGSKSSRRPHPGEKTKQRTVHIEVTASVVSPSPAAGPPLEPPREAEARALAEAFAASSAKERERLCKIMDFLPCYVALINAEYRVIYHNKAFVQYFGTPDNRPCYACMRRQEKPCRFCQVPDTAAGKETSSVMEWVHPETRHAFRVYSYPFEDVDGSRCVLETGFNITSVLRVQQALDLSEQSYRVITDNLSIGIALVDPELRVKTGNTRMGLWFSGGFRQNGRVCELLHCGPEWERALAERGVYCPGCPFKASLDDGSGHEKELSVAFQDGREHTVRLVTCPVIPAKGKNSRARALILMLEDIGNRIQVTRQLQRARKLEAMNTLAGGIAHEINQPLSALHLYAGGLQMLLEKSGELPQETTLERLGLIMREADKIRSIISHMRALVMKEGSVSLGPVDLADCVHRVHEVMRNQFSERGIVFERHIAEGLPPVRANETQMEQVLVNILGNAVHALEQQERVDKRIRLTADMLAHTGMGAGHSAGMVRLCVEDNGPGLAEGGEHVFDPFFTTKEKHEGMGLGLSIAHGLVTLWGGAISAKARGSLGGAMFMVDLRIDSSAGQVDAPDGGAGGGNTVLPGNTGNGEGI